MIRVTRLFLTIFVIALCVTHAVFARTHRHESRRTAPAAIKTGVKIPVETNRDPADIALDHKIKGICRGC
jgi:hypothetical protein